MKVLHVTPLPPDYIGGLSLFCKNLVINLKNRKNVHCDILTINLLNNNIKRIKINNSINVFFKKKIFFYRRGLLYPISFIFPFILKNRLNYDIIHVHGYHFFTTIQCAIMKKILGFPFILHIHGGIQTTQNVNSSWFEKFLLFIKNTFFDRFIGKFVIKAADKIISVAKKDSKIIGERYNIEKNNNYYIPIGIDIDKFKKNDEIERKFITLLATRLTYVKGVDIFIEIINSLYKKNKNLRFLIIGDGPLKNIVLKAKNHIPIEYYESFQYDRIQEIYNASEILLITSRTEGVPSIIYESFACETPVISSNVGGISSIIKPKKNGYLFNINNLNEVVKLILNLLEDKQNLRILGKNGRNLVREKYSWEAITEKIYNIYKELIP